MKQPTGCGSRHRKSRVTGLIRREFAKLTRLFTNPTFVFLTIVGNGLLLGLTWLFYLAEHPANPTVRTYFDALWWGIATITTVAYGDIVPITPWGRVIGIALIYSGTVCFVTFTGIVLTFLMQEQVETEIEPLEQELRREEQEQAHIMARLHTITQQLTRIESRLPPPHGQ